MSSIRRILVAVKDTRRGTSPAVARAAVLARSPGARLELFHAICEPVAFEAFGSEGMAKLEEKRRAMHLAHLEKIAAPLRRRGLRVTTAVEWDYPAWEALVRRAVATGADLIVANRHPTAHKASWLLRYADWELLRQSPVPVLLVKKRQPWRAPRVLAAVDPTHAFDKTAQLDQAILAIASATADATRGKLHVLHAYVPMGTGVDARKLREADASQVIADAAADAAAERLDKVLKAARLNHLRVGQRHLVPLHPVDSIPRTAKQLGCEVVVMGAISRSGLKRLVIGNTAERLLDDLPCDVLVVKPAGFRTRVPKRTRGVQLYFASPPSAMT